MIDGFRPRRLALGERRQRAVARQLQALLLDVPVGDLAAHLLVPDRRPVLEVGVARQLHQLVDIEAARRQADRQPLVHQGGERGLPALAHLAQALAVGNAHVGEEHLVEVGAARHLLDRPHLDARRLHRQEEHGEAGVLGHVGIGAGDDDAVVAVVRARGPHLLAVDHPTLAVPLGPRADAGHVGARRRLGEQLAPHFLAVQRRLDVALEMLGRGIGHHGGDAHAQPDVEEAQRHQVVRLFLLVDHLQDGRAAAAAILLRPGDAGVARLGLLVLPLLGFLEQLRIVVAGAEALLVVALARGVGIEPGAHFLAERGFFRRVVEIHGFLQNSVIPTGAKRSGGTSSCGWRRMTRSLHYGPAALRSG